MRSLLEEELTVKVFCSMFIPAGLKISPQAVTIFSNRNSIRDWGGLPNSQNKLERSHFRTTCKCFQNPSESPWRQNGKLVHQRCDNIFNKSIFSEGNTFENELWLTQKFLTGFFSPWIINKWRTFHQSYLRFYHCCGSLTCYSSGRNKDIMVESTSFLLLV